METLLILMLLPPLVGMALNGVLGRRFSQAVVSLIGCGASGLSVVFALLSAWTYTTSPGQPAPFIHSYSLGLNPEICALTTHSSTIASRWS